MKAGNKMSDCWKVDQYVGIQTETEDIGDKHISTYIVSFCQAEAM